MQLPLSGAGIGTSQNICAEHRPVTQADLLAFGIAPGEAASDRDLADLVQYPVLSEGGWFIVIKDRASGREVARRRWRLLGPIELLSHNLVLD